MDSRDSSASDAQQPVIASIYPSLEYWTSTSFQTPSSPPNMSVSALAPSTLLTLLPHFGPNNKQVGAANGHHGNLYPELPSFFEVMSEPQPLETPSSVSASSTLPTETQDTGTAPPSLPPSDNPQDFQQRKTSDGGPVEEASVGLTLPKDPPDQPDPEPGMVIKQALHCAVTYTCL